MLRVLRFLRQLDAESSEVTNQPNSTSPIQITSWWTSFPAIPRRLYTKAAEANSTLTSLERLLLLSRLDLVGKALANPQSVTEAERNQLIYRPHPQNLALNIRRYIPIPEGHLGEDGALIRERSYFTTIQEVISAYHTPERIAQLNKQAQNMITCDWRTTYDETPPPPWDPNEDNRRDPGGEAAAALMNLMHPEEEAFEKAASNALNAEYWAKHKKSCDAIAAQQEAAAKAAGPARAADQEGKLSKEEQAVLLDVETARLREEMRVEVRKKLEAMSRTERRELVKLRKQMQREVDEEFMRELLDERWGTRVDRWKLRIRYQVVDWTGRLTTYM